MKIFRSVILLLLVAAVASAQEAPERQPGPLLQPGNVFDRWFDTEAGFERNSTGVPADFQERLFPPRIGGLRGHDTRVTF